MHGPLGVHDEHINTD